MMAAAPTPPTAKMPISRSVSHVGGVVAQPGYVPYALHFLSRVDGKNAEPRSNHQSRRLDKAKSGGGQAQIFIADETKVWVFTASCPK